MITVSKNFDTKILIDFASYRQLDDLVAKIDIGGVEFVIDYLDRRIWLTIPSASISSLVAGEVDGSISIWTKSETPERLKKGVFKVMVLSGTGVKPPDNQLMCCPVPVVVKIPQNSTEDLAKAIANLRAGIDSFAKIAIHDLEKEKDYWITATEDEQQVVRLDVTPKTDDPQ